MQTENKTRTHPHAHARTHSLTHSLTHARTHAHAHAHAHAHTHDPRPPSAVRIPATAQHPAPGPWPYARLPTTAASRAPTPPPFPPLVALCFSRPAPPAASGDGAGRLVRVVQPPLHFPPRPPLSHRRPPSPWPPACVCVCVCVFVCACSCARARARAPREQEGGGYRVRARAGGRARLHLHLGAVDLGGEEEGELAAVDEEEQPHQHLECARDKQEISTNRRRIDGKKYSEMDAQTERGGGGGGAGTGAKFSAFKLVGGACGRIALARGARSPQPYKWRPCGVTWDSSQTVVVIKLRRTSALNQLGISICCSSVSLPTRRTGVF